MKPQYLLDIHLGYRSEFALDTGKEVLRCAPGDLHMLTNKNVKTVIHLLEENAVSATGKIRTEGHGLVDALVTIQELPAIRLESGTVTNLDIRNIQAAKAKAASAVFALLAQAGIGVEGGAVCIRTIDGKMPLADAVRIGMLPKGLLETNETIAEDAPAQNVSLNTPEVIHAYTEHVLFP